MSGNQSDESPRPPVVSAELLASLGRELREPLHALAGLVDLLGGTALDDRGRELLGLVRGEVGQLGSLVDDLIDATRLQSGDVPLSPRPASPGALVADIVAVGAARAASDAVRVVADIGPGVPPAVMVDPSRLRQLLDKLVTNAVAFTPVGRVSVAVSVEGERLVFQVADTGMGIPADELPAVFEPFNRGRNARGAGTGLGLTIVHQLATLMDGTVDVASEEHEGTTFIVRLPLVATDEPPQEHDQPLLDGAGLPVLVVDDEPLNRMIAIAQLAHLGLHGEAVSTGEEAVERLASGQGPDLVLMDVMLPGIDGLEATRRIRDQERRSGRRCVVIGVTASALATDRFRAEEAGMDDVLAKPVSLATLTHAMGRWVRGGLRLPADRSPVEATVLDDLAADLGSEAVVTDLVRLYLNELHGRRYALAESADQGDIAAAKAMAHTLKSSSMLLGAFEVGHACQRMSTVERPAELYPLVADVMRTSTAAGRWLQHWLSERPTTAR